MPAGPTSSPNCIEACRHTTLVWRDANSPIEFYVCLLIALLVLAAWLHFRKALAACEGRDAN